MEAEVWKPIAGYEGLYEVSSLGQVRSLPRDYHFGMIESTILMKLDTVNGGYLRVTLSKNGKRKRHMVNRLVAQAFIPNPGSKPVVNHINTIRTDNRVANLEWCTYKENSNHADCPKKISAKVSKSVVQCQKDGTPIAVFPSMTAAANALEKVHVSEISKCVRDFSRNAGGYKWRLWNERN